MSHAAGIGSLGYLGFKVKDPAVLKNFKAGDFVEGAYIEALAVSVQKPAAKAPAAPAAPAKK